MDKKKSLEKERLERITSNATHDDEFATSRKDMASFTEEPVNASNETFKVLVIDYYATGEGRHVLIKTGTEGLVKEGIGDWLYQGADVYTVEQWLNIDKIPHSRSYQNSNIETLKSFAPVLWGAMNEGVSMFVDIEYHWSRG